MRANNVTKKTPLLRHDTTTKSTFTPHACAENLEKVECDIYLTRKSHHKLHYIRQRASLISAAQTHQVFVLWRQDSQGPS